MRKLLDSANSTRSSYGEMRCTTLKSEGLGGSAVEILTAGNEEGHEKEAVRVSPGEPGLSWTMRTIELAPSELERC